MSACASMVREGLFTDDDPPALLGSRCARLRLHPLPARRHLPLLRRRRTRAGRSCRAPGTLWAWTAVTAPPPGYQGEVPYGIGVVELPEGVRVITRLTESDPAALSAGQPMELRVVPLHRTTTATTS